MKYLYLSVGIVLLTVVVFSSKFTAEDELGKKNGVVGIYQGFDEGGELGATLDLIVPREPIPKVPLKDLFADPLKSNVEKQNIEQTVEAATESVDGKQSINIITPPRLIGVVIRDSGARAFFADNDKLYSLKQGDTLVGRYQVALITPEKVNVKEISTGLSRNIYIKDE